jgi:hypothetical protein
MERMNEKEIFAMGFGLTGTPGQVVEATLDLTQKPGRLHLRLDFPLGSGQSWGASVHRAR